MVIEGLCLRAIAMKIRIMLAAHIYIKRPL